LFFLEESYALSFPLMFFLISTRLYLISSAESITRYNFPKNSSCTKNVRSNIIKGDICRTTNVILSYDSETSHECANVFFYPYFTCNKR